VAIRLKEENVHATHIDKAEKCTNILNKITEEEIIIYTEKIFKKDLNKS
jgi:hypothetical protein